MLFVAFIQDENNPLLCTFSFASLWAVFSLGTYRGNLKHDLDECWFQLQYRNTSASGDCAHDRHVHLPAFFRLKKPRTFFWPLHKKYDPNGLRISKKNHFLYRRGYSITFSGVSDVGKIACSWRRLVLVYQSTRLLPHQTNSDDAGYIASTLTPHLLAPVFKIMYTV